VVLLFFTYKQLFGYGVWGTIWRLVMSFVCGYTSWSILLNVNYGIHLLKTHQHDAAMSTLMNIPIALLLLVVILCICYLISKPCSKKHKSEEKQDPAAVESETSASAPDHSAVESDGE
ncbi:MAG: hypothetical protein J5503_06780, partial [Muribaculaceae bacterium]|nr:hypothetical protein [Muribaculaceae bacterium]